MIKRFTVSCGAVVALTAVLAACGGDDDDADSGTDRGRRAATRPPRRRHRGTWRHCAGWESAHPTTPARPLDGASITIALGSEPTSLDPHIVDDGGERAINDNIYETLLTRTPDGELGPGARHRAADPGRRHDVGVHAPRRRHVPRRHAVQRRLGRRHASTAWSVSSAEEQDRQRAASTRTLAGAEEVDDLTVRIMTDRARRRAAGAHVLAEDRRRPAPRPATTCRTPRTAPARTRSSSRETGVSHRARRQRRLLGRRAARSRR